MESSVTAPVSGHVKRVVVHEGMLMLRCWKSSSLTGVNTARRGFNRPRRPCCGNRTLKGRFTLTENDVIQLLVA